MRDVDNFVAESLVCQIVKVEHIKPCELSRNGVVRIEI